MITVLFVSTSPLPVTTAVEEEDSAAEVVDVVDAVETVVAVVEDEEASVAEVEEDVVEVAVASDSVVEGVEDPPSKARRLHSKLLLVR